MLNLISKNKSTPAYNVPTQTSNNRNAFAVIEVVESVSKATTAEEAFQAALDSVRKAFSWEYGSFWQLDKESRVLRFKVESGSVNPEFHKVTQNASFAEGVGICGKAWAAKDLVFVEDLGVMTDCSRRESAQNAGVKSGVCFPIISKGQVLGTMDFFSTQALQFEKEQLEVLKSIGRIVSNAVERIRNESLHIETAQASAAISQVLQNVNRATTEADAIKIALESVRSSLDWAYGSYWAIHPTDNVLRFALQTGTVTPEFQQVTQNASFKEGVGLSGKAWQKKDLIFVKDLGTMTDCCRRESAQRAGVKSGICFPIIVNGEIIGTMDFFSLKTLEPSQDRMDALLNVSQIVSSSLERIRKYEKDMALSNQFRQSAKELKKFSEELKATGVKIYQNACLSSNQAKEVAEKSYAANQSTRALSGSITEMSSSVQEISRNTQQATQVTQNAEIKAQESKKMMDTLGRSAHEINSVVDLIKDIASQTNLLALNATIEAASAGEAGKGFAVVANEVKALAKQSAEATDNIRTKVETIQQNTQDAIQVIEVIAHTIVEINEIISTIASAVEEQSATASEISHEVSGTNEAINGISQSIEQLAKMSQETSDSAASLEDLNNSLDSFRALVSAV